MKIDELVASAKSLLLEAEQAIERGDLELAGTKQAEAAGLRETIKAMKAQNDMNKELASFDEPEPEQEPAKAVRMPFDVDEPETDKADADPVQKSVYQIKYGTMETAQKAVITDLYGTDYYQKRHNQWNAFSKYLRTGKLNAREEESLSGIILLPDAVAAQIKGGFSVGEVKATLQEGVNDLGGFLVPEDYRVDIIKRMMGLTVVRGRARQVNTIRDAAE